MEVWDLWLRSKQTLRAFINIQDFPLVIERLKGPTFSSLVPSPACYKQGLKVLELK